MNRALFTCAALLVLGISATTSCAGWLARSEGLDPTTLPDAVRPDYEMFAQRCSKCHSLARPLSSGIDDDDYWALYVARMRRQQGSGISVEDTVPILRFLHYYSEEQLRKKGKHESSPPPPASVAPPAPSAAPMTAPPAASPPQPPATSGQRDGERRQVL